MRLCLALGWPHPDYLLPYLTARQLADWIELWGCDPWGEQRADLRASVIARMVIAPYTKRRVRPIDIMPYLDKPAQSAEDMRNTMKDILHGVADRSSQH